MVHPESIVKASDEVIGVDVKNAEDESLGAIEEIMLDKYSGEVRYVVLSFGGFLGIGDKLFAIPWRALSYSPEDDCFILNVSKERLKDAPGFPKDNWPNVQDHVWGESIFKFYNTKPYWQDKL